LPIPFNSQFIGYTDDMHSVAAHGDRAIVPLLEFIDPTDSRHAKYGAVLALHLIGIERRPARYGFEKFTNQKARKALLSLLSHRDLQVRLLRLLVRDPWPSDVPRLLTILRGDTPHSWAFIKALQRYHISDPPVHQRLPKALADLPCDGEWEMGKSEHGYHETLVAALVQAADRRLSVERGLLRLDLWGDMRWTACLAGSRFGSVLEWLTGCGHCYLGSKLEYYLEAGRVHVCSMSTARRRWIEWHDCSQKHTTGNRSRTSHCTLMWLAVGACCRMDITRGQPRG